MLLLILEICLICVLPQLSEANPEVGVGCCQDLVPEEAVKCRHVCMALHRPIADVFVENCSAFAYHIISCNNSKCCESIKAPISCRLLCTTLFDGVQTHLNAVRCNEYRGQIATCLTVARSANQKLTTTTPKTVPSTEPRSNNALYNFLQPLSRSIGNAASQVKSGEQGENGRDVLNRLIKGFVSTRLTCPYSDSMYSSVNYFGLTSFRSSKTAKIRKVRDDSECRSRCETDQYCMRSFFVKITSECYIDRSIDVDWSCNATLMTHFPVVRKCSKKDCVLSHLKGCNCGDQDETGYYRPMELFIYKYLCEDDRSWISLNNTCKDAQAPLSLMPHLITG